VATSVGCKDFTLKLTIDEDDKEDSDFFVADIPCPDSLCARPVQRGKATFTLRDLGCVHFRNI
jgi:hypothetical protein